jgi:carboxyl-terminal processing protease
MQTLRAISLGLISSGLLLLLTACSGEGGPVGRWVDQSNEACFFNGGKQQVLDIMRDWYLWNDEADQYNKYRNLSLNNFEDAEDLLDFLRYQPAEFDRGFSYITTPEEEQAFFGEGQFIGFGFSMAFSENGIYFTQVFSGSPAAEEGFERGYRLVAINGRNVLTFPSGEEFAAAFGPDEVGFSASFTVEDTTGAELPVVSLSKALITLDPVPEVEIVQDGLGNDVGYILFDTFISSADSQLRNAFTSFDGAAVDRVVIDLRYNGGGLVSVAEVLASLMAPGHVGDVFTTYRFNSDRAAEYDQTVEFHSEAEALNLDKIVFITSEGSASASELIINGLKPYFSNVDLGLVGSPTYGKPVGQFAFDFCNDSYRLRAVAFKSVNAEGDGDYYDGLPVNCQAEDDLSLPLGDPNEGSLAAALEYMETDGVSCSTSFAPGFNISRVAGKVAKVQPVFGPTLAQQYAGAF